MTSWAGPSSIHIPNALLKIYSCGTDTAIDGPIPFSKYSGWDNTVDALGLMNLSAMDPLAFPRSLSTEVANNVSKLSMINADGGGFFAMFYLMFPGSTILVTASSLALPLLFYLENLSLSVVLGVRS